MIIYKTTNLINGKIYVGKDVKNNHSYIGSGFIFRISVEKYGKENFKKEILEYCHTIEELNKKEKYWIKTLNSTDKNIGYNIMEGGQGGNCHNYKRGPEHYLYRKPLPQKVRDAVSLANTQRPKVYGECNKTYKKVDDKIKIMILDLSKNMGRDKIYNTLTSMGVKCPPRRTIGRRLKEWSIA
jgi:hypothetical protein